MIGGVSDDGNVIKVGIGSEKADGVDKWHYLKHLDQKREVTVSVKKEPINGILWRT